MQKELLTKQKLITASLSILMNLSLTVIKYIGGVIAQSPALIADATHSLSDLAASAISFLGIKISNLKHEKFPYGLYKVENLVALFSAFAIYYAGYEIIKEVLLQNYHPQLKNLPLALGIVILCIVIMYSFHLYEKKKAKELNSPALASDAKHILTDVYSSLIVVIGIIAQYLNLYYLEVGAILIIVILIIWNGTEILLDSIKALLDYTIDEQTKARVEKIIKKKAPVVNYSISGRQAGSYIFLDIELGVNIKDGYPLDEFKENLIKEIKNSIDFIDTININTRMVLLPTIAIMIDKDHKSICQHVTSCPYIIFIQKTKEGSWKEIKFIENPASTLEKQKGVTLTKFLKEENIDCVIVGVGKRHRSRNILDRLQMSEIKVIETDILDYKSLDLDKLCTNETKKSGLKQ